MKILVVDDYSTMRRIVRNLLNQIGYFDIEEADNGEDAWAKIRSCPYALVLSDWNMSPVSGLELLKRVRGEARVAHTPFIFITAESKPENILAAKCAGVNNYIIKPFTAETLKAKIAATLTKARECA